MDEVALRWIERVGFPIFVSCLSLYATFHLFKMFLSKSNVLQETLSSHSQQMKDLTEHTNKALGMNTLATNELTDTMKKKLGSDPEGLCKFNAYLKASGYDLTEEELSIIVAARERKRREAAK